MNDEIVCIHNQESIHGFTTIDYYYSDDDTEQAADVIYWTILYREYRGDNLWMMSDMTAATVCKGALNYSCCDGRKLFPSMHDTAFNLTMKRSA